MALFPAYSTLKDDNNQLEDVAPSSSGDGGFNSFPSRIPLWLENSSFSAILTNSAGQVPAHSIVSDSHVTEKKHKRDKERRKPKVKRERSRSRPVAKEPPSLSKKTVPVQPAKWSFLQQKKLPAQLLQQPTYLLDVRRELENLQYGEFYKRHIANFRYGARRQCLGGNETLIRLLYGADAAVRKLKNQRYFSIANRSRLRAAPTEAIASTVRAIDLSKAELIPVPNWSVDSDTAQYKYDSATGGVVTTAADEEVGLQADEFLQENKRLNQWLDAHPRDVDTWIKLIDLQDKLGFGSKNVPGLEERKMTMRGLAERKLSVLAVALKSNVQSVELKLLRMRIAEDCLDTEQLKEEWRKVEFAHVNDLRMWAAYLEYFQSRFAAFSVTKACKLYDRCIEKLQAVLAGKLVTHLPSPGCERFLLEVVVARCKLLKRAGHMEKAVACFQAAIEFNLFQPNSIKELSIDQKRSFFEPYWDNPESGKFGEPGAMHWQDVFDKKEAVSGTEASTLQLDPSSLEDEISAVPGVSDGILWTRLEDLRSEYHWLPWHLSRSDDNVATEPEDPERTVLFEDIAPCLIQFSSTSLKFNLIVEFLRFLDATMLPLGSSNTCSGMQELFPTLPRSLQADLTKELPEPSLHKAETVIRNVFVSAISVFAGPRQRYLSVCHFLTEFQWLRENRTISPKDRVKQFRAFAKQYLKVPEHRNDVLLYDMYATCLTQLSCMDEAKTVLYSAVQMIASTNVLASLKDVSFEGVVALRVLVDLTRLLACMEPDRSRMLLTAFFCGDLSLGLGDLAKLTDVHMLKARRTLQSVLSEHKAAYGKQSMDLFVTGWIGSPLSLIAELAMSLEAARGETREIGDLFASISEIMKQRKEETLTDSKASSIMQFNERFAALDADCERLTQCYVRLMTEMLMRPPLGSLVQVREIAEQALQVYPLNEVFLFSYVDMHLRGHLMTKLRAFFNKTLSKHPTWWLCALKAELVRLEQITATQEQELMNTSRIGEVYRIRHLFARAMDACPNCDLLWRLALQWEIQRFDETRAEGARRVFFEGVRQCPWAKQLYTDAIRYWPTEVQRVVDMMSEKELRIRVAVEELELLREAAVQQKDDDRISETVKSDAEGE